jgi:hypothetical protein
MWGPDEWRESCLCLWARLAASACGYLGPRAALLSTHAAGDGSRAVRIPSGRGGNVYYDSSAAAAGALPVTSVGGNLRVTGATGTRAGMEVAPSKAASEPGTSETVTPQDWASWLEISGLVPGPAAAGALCSEDLTVAGPTR